MTGGDFIKAIIFGVEEENPYKNLSENELQVKKNELEQALEKEKRKSTPIPNTDSESYGQGELKVLNEHLTAVDKIRAELNQVEVALNAKQNPNAQNNTSNQQQESTGKPWWVSYIVNAITEGINKADIKVLLSNSGI